MIPNQNTLCVATYQGDLAPSLMVLEGIIHIIGPNGQREVPVDDFFQLDGITRNVLENGEFVLKVTFPKGVENRVGSYKKLRVRESWDFPEAGVASSWIAGQPSSFESHQLHWNRYQGLTKLRLIRWARNFRAVRSIHSRRR